jgi:hypothetical protein
MEKSYSEKVARVFEIGCYFMIIPGILGILLSLYIWVSGIGLLFTTGNPLVLVIAAIILSPAIIGFWLFSAYIKHSRGSLETDKINRMWVLSIILNGIFSLPIAFAVIATLGSGTSMGLSINSISEIILLTLKLSMIAWWIAATILPITALVSIKRNDNVR